MNNCWMPDLTEDQYHSDRNRLGSTGLATLFLDTPLEFIESRTNPETVEDSQALYIGDLFHKLTFYKDYQGRIRVEPSGDKRTKPVQAAMAEFEKTLTDDSIVLKDKDATLVLGMMNALIKHEKASKLLSNGIPEQAGFFDYEHNYIGDDGEEKTRIIKGKFKPDFMRNNGIICDLKTVRAGRLKPYGFFQQVKEHAYLIQAAWYCIGYEKITGYPPKGWVFIVVEKKHPYMVACYEVQEAQLELGRMQLKQALDKYCRCLDSGVWPGHEEIMPLEIPDYYYQIVG